MTKRKDKKLQRLILNVVCAESAEIRRTILYHIPESPETLVTGKPADLILWYSQNRT